MSARSLRAVSVAAATARLSYALLRRTPPGGAGTWQRTNHRGEPITLLEGPAVILGGVAGALAGGGSGRDRAAVAIAGAGAAAFGGYDDLYGNGQSRGFRGHLGALRAGELTTGAVKVAGIGATSLTAALIAGGDSDSVAGLAADAVINTGLIALGANLLNLFDLRPGRAIKVALIAGGPLAAAGSAAAAPLAAAAALLPDDLGERSMLGDAGANALGAMLGAAAATSLPRPARLAALARSRLTAASEYVSFTKVIERAGPLRWLDMLGRRPVRAQPDGPRPAATPSASAAAAAPATPAPDEHGVDRPAVPQP